MATYTLYSSIRRLGMLLVVALVFIGTGAARASTPSFGATLAPAVQGSSVLSVQAFVPVFVFEDDGAPVRIAARADLATRLDFATLPSVQLAAEAALGPADEVHAYVATGIVVVARTVDASRDWLAAWSLVGGVRIPIDATFAARIEAVSTPQLGAIGIGIGLDITPWR